MVLEIATVWHYATGENEQPAMSFLEAVSLHFPVQSRSVDAQRPSCVRDVVFGNFQGVEDRLAFELLQRGNGIEPTRPVRVAR